MRLIKKHTKEELIIKQCKKNDPKAQRALFDTHAPKMLAVCSRYTKTLEEAEEVLSNGFIKVLTRIKQYNGEGSFEGWIRRIMVNESLNYIRGKQALFVEIDENKLSKQDFFVEEENFAEEELLKMIAQLPEGYRAVFNLYAIEGYNHKEIAEKLGVTESTSKTQLRRARLHLQGAIEEQEKKTLKSEASSR